VVTITLETVSVGRAQGKRFKTAIAFFSGCRRRIERFGQRVDLPGLILGDLAGFQEVPCRPQ
jgi:hypothetical protein